MGPAVPVAIALMVFGLQFKNLLALPKSLLKIFAVGTFASIFGGVVMALAFTQRLGVNSAKLAAQLTASYIGGNENAVAVAKILDVPNELFVAVFAIDNVVTSLWMVTTIALARSQLVEDPKHFNDQTNTPRESYSMTIVGTFASISLALLSVRISHLLAEHIGFFHPMLYLTGVAFLLSRFQWIQNLIKPAYLLGTIVFAPFFFSTGAISDLHTLGSIPIEALLMPFCIVGIHGIIIYSVGKALAVPSCETSLASQALIGGAGTAIALAQAKNWKTGISLGLILGLVGYAIANFCGVLVFHISNNLIELMGLAV